jgi:hypothetical protein
LFLGFKFSCFFVVFVFLQKIEVRVNKTNEPALLTGKKQANSG